MADLIQASSASEGWLRAMEFMVSDAGSAVNLCVAFPAGAREPVEIEEELNRFIAEHEIRYQDDLLTVGRVANTIFPAALYHPHLGSGAAPRLYENYELSMRMHRRRKNDKETYFNRLIAYPVAPLSGDSACRGHPKGTWNQLDYYVKRLTKQRETLHRSSAYELGISHPMDAELRVQAPFIDKRMGSFPCLSHISLTLAGEEVHMCATYRNQTFITRALGNYLGLAALLRFIATESGGEPGELLVVSTHADAEVGGRSAAVRDLVVRCRELLDGAAVDEVTHA